MKKWIYASTSDVSKQVVRGMTVKKLNDFLSRCPQDMEVYVEMNINGMEFDCPISDIYESGKLYIYGKDKFDVKIIKVEDSNEY